MEGNEGVSVGGYWLVPEEPDQLTAEAMLIVDPDCYDWRTPDQAATAAHSAAVDLAPPEGHSWN